MDAKTIEQLDKIREGRRVSVAYTQRPHLSVCSLSGRWVRRDYFKAAGYGVMGKAGNYAVILLTDAVTVVRKNGTLHLRVDLAGRRMPPPGKWPPAVMQAYFRGLRQTCRVCGCTDDDCAGCIERTGEPCHWAEDDLCSACANTGRETGE